MRVCLINAPNAAEFSDALEFNDEEVRQSTCSPQLGILSLAAVTEALGMQTVVYDPNRAFFRFADMLGQDKVHDFAHLAAQQIADIGADVYGFGSICSAYPLSLRIAECLKKIQPECIIVFGGPQASVVAGQTLKAFAFVDLILRGESENSFPSLLEALSRERSYESVPGLTYKTVFGVQGNLDAPVIACLDDLPLPAYHLTGELLGAGSAALELGRGCPFACTFCSTNDFFRRKFRLRSPQRVLEDMCAIHARYGITDFDLVHDMFTVDAKRVRAFCEAMIESGKGFSWACSARTDCVDQEMIELMAAAGCRGIFFGVETGSDRLQHIIDKHLDTRRAREIIDITERAGIESTVSLITGFPEEQWNDLRETLNVLMHSARTPRSKPQINILAPLPNTPVQLKYKQQLTLGPMSSDVSHQAQFMHPEDIELIRRFPDIFPSFYLLPTPDLDRDFLLELREFLLMAVFHFRWLLGAADQASTCILGLLVEWVNYRKFILPLVVGPGLRHYYRTPSFKSNFIAFLRNRPISRDFKVRVLIEFYERLNGAESPDLSIVSNAIELASTESISEGDIAIRRYQSRVIELPDDLEAVIDAVRERKELKGRQGAHFYIVSQVQIYEHPGSEISDYCAKLLELCNGRRTVAQITERLADHIYVTPQTARDRVYLMLLENMRSEGLISMYRIASLAAANQPHFQLVEYSDINAEASRQNQRSIHVE